MVSTPQSPNDSTYHLQYPLGKEHGKESKGTKLKGTLLTYESSVDTLICL